jgi:serine/threonine-protein kinase
MVAPGHIIANKYRLDRLIGKGAFATVWAATNMLIDRQIALKVLHPQVAADPTAVARLLREAKIAAKSLHPTLVHVEDIGQTEKGLPFLVMEYLHGQSLATVLRYQGKLSCTVAAEILRQCLEGLAAAHQHDVIHRDIKPANVFVVSEARQGVPIRLLDLGLARDLSECNRLTQTGRLVGTANFLAPEILLAQVPEGGTKQADVFAMGMVFFLMLTRRLPFETDPPLATPAAEIIYRARYYQSGPVLPGPAQYEPNVPPAVDAFVRRALCLEPDKRYRDARHMVTELSKVVTPPSSKEKTELAATIHSLAAEAGEKAARRSLTPAVANDRERHDKAALADGPRSSATPPGATPPADVFAAAREPRWSQEPPARLKSRSVPPAELSQKTAPHSQGGTALTVAFSALAVVALFMTGGIVTWTILHHRADAQMRGANLAAANSMWGPTEPTGNEEAEAGAPNAGSPTSNAEDNVVIILERLPPGAEVRFNQQLMQGAVIRRPRNSAGLLEITRPEGEPLRRVVTFNQDQSLDIAAELQAADAARAEDAEKGGTQGGQRATTGKLRRPRRQTRQRRRRSSADGAGAKRPLSAGPEGSVQDPWSP